MASLPLAKGIPPKDNQWYYLIGAIYVVCILDDLMDWCFGETVFLIKKHKQTYFQCSLFGIVHKVRYTGERFNRFFHMTKMNWLTVVFLRKGKTE
jgi:hypothetical protein